MTSGPIAESGIYMPTWISWVSLVSIIYVCIDCVKWLASMAEGIIFPQDNPHRASQENINKLRIKLKNQSEQNRRV